MKKPVRVEWFVYSTLTHGFDPKGDILVILSAVNSDKEKQAFRGGDDA